MHTCDYAFLKKYILQGFNKLFINKFMKDKGYVTKVVNKPIDRMRHYILVVFERSVNLLVLTK